MGEKNHTHTKNKTQNLEPQTNERPHHHQKHKILQTYSFKSGPVLIF